jgi:hypothetical protein
MNRNNNRLTHILIVFSLVSLLFSSCQKDKKDTAPDISDIKVDLVLHRFEQDLFQIDTNQMTEQLEVLTKKYPLFSALYFEQLIGAKRAPQGFENYVKGFISFPEVRQLYDTCTLLFGELETYRSELETAFKYYRHYFPEQPTPQVTTYISEYTIGALIYGEDQLAVGLDFFLGADYPYAKYNPGNPNFSNYLIRSFNPDHMVMKTLQPLVEDIAGTEPGSRMLDIMINEGKKFYLMDLLLPNTPDSVIFEMPIEDVKWLEDNELEIWAYLLQAQLFYESEWKKIRKFVEYSPRVPQMHPDAPGRAANWVAWKIVKAYMERNPTVTLPELMATKDAQRILDGSKYKPPR